MSDSYVMNPGDWARLRDSILSSVIPPAYQTLMGVPVSTSGVVPPGQVLRVRPQPMEPIAFAGFDPAPGEDRTVWIRHGFDRISLRPQFSVLTLCDGWSPATKRLTAAQRRRKAKRYIREEVARRRMLKGTQP